MEINLGLGKGLTIEDNKVTTNLNPTSVSDNLINKKEDGLYVPSLKGNDGGAGGSSPDGWTVEVGARPDIIQTNRDVVQMIFTMCLWKLAGRTTNTIAIASPKTRKTKADVISEINWRKNQGQNLSAYDVIVGDLFQFKDNVAPGKVTWGTAYEDGNRYMSDYVHALFVVESVTRETSSALHKVTDIKLRCLWSDTEAGYIAGAILA